MVLSLPGHAADQGWSALPRDRNSKGDRRPDDWLGAYFQVSGLGHRDPGSDHQVQVRVREIDPLSSVIDPLSSVIDPTIDSVIAPLQVAGGSPG